MQCYLCLLNCLLPRPFFRLVFEVMPPARIHRHLGVFSITYRSCMHRLSCQFVNMSHLKKITIVRPCQPPCWCNNPVVGNVACVNIFNICMKCCAGEEHHLGLCKCCSAVPVIGFPAHQYDKRSGANAN